jgi:hypothetical protein
MSIQGKASAVKHGIADNTTTIKEQNIYITSQ